MSDPNSPPRGIAFHKQLSTLRPEAPLVSGTCGRVASMLQWCCCSSCEMHVSAIMLPVPQGLRCASCLLSMPARCLQLMLSIVLLAGSCCCCLTAMQGSARMALAVAGCCGLDCRLEPSWQVFLGVQLWLLSRSSLGRGEQGRGCAWPCGVAFGNPCLRLPKCSAQQSTCEWVDWVLKIKILVRDFFALRGLQ